MPTHKRGTMEEHTAGTNKKRSIIATLKGLAFTLMVLACLWVGLRYVLAPVMLPESFEEAQQEKSASATSYEERIAALEQKVAALSETKPQMPDLSALEERLAALESRPAASGDSTAPSMDPQVLDALKTEIDSIKANEHTILKSVILIHQLQDAVRAGKPFSAELAALTRLRPDLTEILAPLDGPGAVGVATLEQLQDQFRSAIHPTLTPAGERSLNNNIRSLVKIRKIGDDQKGTDDEAIIARAEARLAAGDIPSALTESENLSPKAARNFAAWQERAKTKLESEAILTKLQANITSGSGE